MDVDVDRTNAPPDHFLGRVLRPHELLAHADYAFAEPAAELKPWIRRYWSVSWDLPEGQRFRSATVSEPAVHLTVERGDIDREGTTGPGIWVTGPVTEEHFGIGLHGRGSVIGVAFRLGATAAFTSGRPSAIRNATVPAEQWFPGIDSRLVLPEGVDSAAEVLDRWLLAHDPVLSGSFIRLTQALEALADPAVTGLAVLADRMGMSERSLQRLFQDHCGVGVKRLLVRSRVRDAVSALDRGWDGGLGDLAMRLGWFDQSHFGADFRRVTGYSPSEYAHDGDGRTGRNGTAGGRTELQHRAQM